MLVKIFLDFNKDYEIELKLTKEKIVTQFKLYNQASSLFLEKIIPHISLIFNSSDTYRLSCFSETIENLKEKPERLEICISDKITHVIKIQPVSNEKYSAEIEYKYQYSVFETRLIAARYNSDSIISPILPTSSTPIFCTDLHTHFDAVLPKEVLIGFAQTYDVSISIKRLEEIYQELGESFPRIAEDFLPFNVISQYYPLVYEKIISNFDIPSGCIYIFGQLELIYSFRDLITGNCNNFSFLLEEITKYYHHYKIKYVELSLHDIIEKKWLEKAIESLPSIEKKYSLRIRFLIALYNYQSPEHIVSDIERIKIIARCPYIVGVDFAGHEQYDFIHSTIDHIENLARWANQEYPDFILRIHAGETSLHQDNIKIALSLAKKYKVRMRLGHAIFGLDNRALDLIDPDKIILETNPDSNLALNNMTSIDELPIKTLYHSIITGKVKLVIACDGPGLYRTSPTQMISPLRLENFSNEFYSAIKQTEKEHLERQKKIFIHRSYFNTIDLPSTSLESPLYRHMPSLDLFSNKGHISPRDKKPILIATRAYSFSVNIFSGKIQLLTDFFISLLTRLDPKEVYFLFTAGDSEVNVVFHTVLSEYNSRNSKKERFDVFRLTQQSPLFTRLINTYICQTISNNFTDYPGNILNIVKSYNGVIFFFSGDHIASDLRIRAISLKVGHLCVDEGTSHSSLSNQSSVFDLEKSESIFRWISERNITVKSGEKPKYLLKKTKMIFLNILSFCLNQNLRSLDNYREILKLKKMMEQGILPARHILVHTGDFHELSGSYQMAIINLLNGYIDWHYQEKRVDETQEIITLHQSIFGTSFIKEKALNYMAELYLTMGRLFTWVSDYNHIIVTYLKTAHTIMSRLYGEFHYEKTLRAYGALAVYYNFHDCFESARPMFEYLLRVEFPENSWQRAGYNSNLGRVLLALGGEKDIKLAEHHIEMARTIYEGNSHPQKFVFHTIMGFCYFHYLKDIEKAEAFFSKVLSAVNDNLPVLSSQPWPLQELESNYGMMLISEHIHNQENASMYLNRCYDFVNLHSMNVQFHPHFKTFLSDCRRVGLRRKETDRRFFFESDNHNSECKMSTLLQFCVFKPKLNTPFKEKSKGKSAARSNSEAATMCHFGSPGSSLS